MIFQSPKLIQSPLVSVVIITYNQEHYIRQCIDSVLAQKTDFDYEIIIGEDCGTDQTRDICIEYHNSYSDKIKLVLNSKNLGVVGNWVNCIKESRGKYILQCAGDDFWHNNSKIQIQISYMEKYSNCGVLHTDFDELNIDTNKTITSYIKTNRIKIPEGRIQKEIFQGNVKMCAPTLCFRKETIDQYIDFRAYIEHRFPIEDWPTLIILSKYSDINYLSISTVTYRRGHESISNPGSYINIIDRFSREKKMYHYLCKLFSDDLRYDEVGYDIYINNVLLNLAYKKRDFKNARKFAKSMLGLGDNSFRARMSQYYLGFYIFCLLKAIKKIR